MPHTIGTEVSAIGVRLTNHKLTVLDGIRMPPVHAGDTARHNDGGEWLKDLTITQSVDQPTVTEGWFVGERE